MVVAATVRVGPVGLVIESSRHIPGDGIIDRLGAGEHDFEPGSFGMCLDREPHPAGDHRVAILDRSDQIVVPTVSSRILMVAVVGRTHLAEFPGGLDAVFDVNDDEALGAAEVSGDGGFVPGGKRDSHDVQDTVDST